MHVNLATGPEKVLFLTLGDNVECQTELDSVLRVVALTTPRKLVVSVVVVAQHMSRAMGKCGTLAIGIEKAH